LCHIHFSLYSVVDGTQCHPSSLKI